MPEAAVTPEPPPARTGVHARPDSQNGKEIGELAWLSPAAPDGYWLLAGGYLE